MFKYYFIRSLKYYFQVVSNNKPLFGYRLGYMFHTDNLNRVFYFPKEEHRSCSRTVEKKLFDSSFSWSSPFSILNFEEESLTICSISIIRRTSWPTFKFIILHNIVNSSTSLQSQRSINYNIIIIQIHYFQTLTYFFMCAIFKDEFAWG